MKEISGFGLPPISVTNVKYKKISRLGIWTCQPTYICAAVKPNNSTKGRIKLTDFLIGFWFTEPLKHICGILKVHGRQV